VIGVSHASPELVGLILFGALVLVFCVVAAVLQGWLVTAPLAFVGMGAVVGFAMGPVDPEQLLGIKEIAEVTLVLILFHDAAQVRPREIGRDRGMFVRLLLVGFPLTVVAGFLAARVMFPELPVLMALLLGAALAPTDAGLGAPTVLNPVVPTRVRRALNVESGLNDGLATPLVLFAIAAIAGSEGAGPGESLVEALVELGVGVLVGVTIGAAGGALLGLSRRRGMSTPASRSLAVLMLPLLAYGLALLSSGNGYVAAFIAGSAFTGAARWVQEEHSVLEGTEALANPLGYAVWLVFGMAAVPLVWRSLGVGALLFGVLALTVLRMVPVALSLIGSGLRAPTVAFIGWFGPRGLASVIFALLTLESLEADDDLRQVLAILSATVLLSVVAHGFSAEPLARRYGAWVQRARPHRELEQSSEPHPRGGLGWP
jgi:NhaP-type Na+/H+ or K+/H+ antiporter